MLLPSVAINLQQEIMTTYQRTYEMINYNYANILQNRVTKENRDMIYQFATGNNHY